MAKELLIVFLYDTELHLREEEDPEKAVVYFHPSWVSANQRMALCGQLIGVAQFLITGFSFPSIISLNTGKFSMKKIGRFILCVGTDRNIPDWILEERCEMLYGTLQFFHSDLRTFHGNAEQTVVREKLTDTINVYLPVLLYAGNIFANSLTIRLPKSASSIFLEAAQILESLQEEKGVHGGAIFYQNKVVISQLNASTTKQIVVIDPYRVKIPADQLQTTIQLPVGVQLLVVYIEEEELRILEEQKIPVPLSKISSFVKKEYGTAKISNICEGDKVDKMKPDRSHICTVLEEESETDQYSSAKQSMSDLLPMPDVVKDSVNAVKRNEHSEKFSSTKVESYVVDSSKKFRRPASCSSEDLEIPDNSMRYCSFGFPPKTSNEKLSDNKLNSKKREDRKKASRKHNFFYNTISDPIYPWFRINGLPASKALHENTIQLYCENITSSKPESADTKYPAAKSDVTEPSLKRPTSIQLNLKDSKKKQRNQKLIDLKLDLKKELPEQTASQMPNIEHEVPITPLMSKLRLSELVDLKRSLSCDMLKTPSASKSFLQCEEVTQNACHNCTESPFKTIRRKSIKKEIALKKSILFVCGHQNITLYLLLNAECGQNPDIIQFLWNTCFGSVNDLERHFQQCFETIPQAQAMNVSNDSYSYVNVHSDWETLQRSGVWTGPQLDLLNTLHNDFNDDSTLVDMTVRLDDSVIYGYQMSDSQVFYQQKAGTIAGLPMPSDLMGVIPLKAKRRLERDHSVLIL